MPTQRPAASLACQARPHAISLVERVEAGRRARGWRPATPGSPRRTPARPSVKLRSIRGPRTGRGPAAPNAARSGLLVGLGERAVGVLAALADEAPASPPTRSARNFWCTSVRFTILFVPVVGGSCSTRTYRGRHFGPMSSSASTQRANAAGSNVDPVARARARPSPGRPPRRRARRTPRRARRRGDGGARPRSGRPGSSRRRPGSSRRCGRRSRGSRRRRGTRGRPTSTSRSAVVFSVAAVVVVVALERARRRRC